jgi:hypothetical protein
LASNLSKPEDDLAAPAITPIVLLLISNVFMTFAWYATDDQTFIDSISEPKFE